MMQGRPDGARFYILLPDGQEARDVPAVTADQMREVDRPAEEVFSLSLLQMMENAGRALAEHAWLMLDERDRGREGRIVVLAGSGGNGGGGLCGARHVHNHGYSVQVALDRPPKELQGAAQHQLHTVQMAGLAALPARGVAQALDQADLIIDALIGYGLRGSSRGGAAELIAMAMTAASRGATILSLDVPSGLDATTGEAHGAVIRPERTLTLALPKTGLASGLAGELYLADIGIPPELYARLGLAYIIPFGEKHWAQLHVRR